MPRERFKSKLLMVRTLVLTSLVFFFSLPPVYLLMFCIVFVVVMFKVVLHCSIMFCLNVCRWGMRNK